MKKLFLLSFLLSCNIYSYPYFEFLDYKENKALSKEFLKMLMDAFNVNIFFETGTFQGNSTLNAAIWFNSVITVELHNELFKNVARKFHLYDNIQAYHGHSPNIIKTIGPALNGNILFWLDAHYCGEGTALGKITSSNAIISIREELVAIKEANIKNCIILIGDIREFGAIINDQEYEGGSWAYPSLQEIQYSLFNINVNFDFALLGDLLLAYDKTLYQPKFSKTVTACTKIRFYNGYNIGNEEFSLLEENIINTSYSEYMFIKTLYNAEANAGTSLVWYDFLYGLAVLGYKNYTDAYTAFSKAKIKSYKYSRVDHYLDLCLKNSLN